MRLILTVGLYLAYIRTFCDYLLTGKYSWTPTDPAGLLGHASTLDQVLARPDGLFLCALFAGACFGLAGLLVNGMRDTLIFASLSTAEVSYEGTRAPKGNFRMNPVGPAKQSDVAKSVANFDTWGPSATSKDKATSIQPPVDPTFSEYVGPADISAPKAPGKQDLPPDQPTK
jgi:hypothetical protein